MPVCCKTNEQLFAENQFVCIESRFREAASGKYRWFRITGSMALGSSEQRDEDRVFMVFQRLHSQTRYPGAGIGLATCKRIVERLRGRIWAADKPGQGP
jgi:hypothetical protein